MKKWLHYLITSLVGLILIFLLCLSKDIFNTTDTKEVYKILVDTFFAIGVVFTSFGLLIVLSNLGSFDIMVFGFYKFFSLFKKERDKITYFDYKESRKDKKGSFFHLLVVGIILIIISLIFLKKYNYC